MTPVVPELPDLRGELYSLVDQIPSGRVTTFGALARALGDVTAALWVAKHLADQFSSLKQRHPVHRIVRQTGELPDSFLAMGAEHLLKRERVNVLNGRVDLGQFGFHDFQSTFPLQDLQALQASLSESSRLSPAPECEFVGGVDVSYQSEMTAVAAYTLVEVKTRRLVWSHVKRHPVTFPYISGYLAFRELPVLSELLAEVRAAGRLAPVLLVDGNGRLHPRHAGIATHLGVLHGIPTIGVGKTLICGTIQSEEQVSEQGSPIVYQGESVATAVRAQKKSRPVYISPGHLTDVPTATELVRRLFRDHRLPEPLFWADHLSRDAAQQGKTC
ncbi:MAG: endonuclease V [Planctomycetales bacterium]